ncbi:MAG: hypothetical protein WBW04_04870 [Nitrolancea sp.]
MTCFTAAITSPVGVVPVVGVAELDDVVVVETDGDEDAAGVDVAVEVVGVLATVDPLPDVPDSVVLVAVAVFAVDVEPGVLVPLVDTLQAASASVSRMTTGSPRSSRKRRPERARRFGGEVGRRWFCSFISVLDWLRIVVGSQLHHEGAEPKASVQTR